MNRLQRMLSVVAIALTITVPSMTAQSRGAQSRRANTYSTNGRSSLGSNSGLTASGQRPGAGGHNNPSSSELNKDQQKHQHNGNHGTHANNGNLGRPGTNGQRPGAAERPENRPGSTTAANSWSYGGNHNSAPKPPVNNLGPVRPSSNAHAPNHIHGNHNNMVAHRPGLNVPPPPPRRPLPPVFNASHYRRPMAPPSMFRPRYHINPLQSILGFTYGTALAASLNALNRIGCQIDGYANNSVYLRNVSALNYMWPDATLYYNNGYLTASSFSYSTSRYDLTRYNSVFAHLSNMYGAPVSMTNGRESMSATWWGYDNQYITLSIQRQKSIGGHLRYYTSLLMGN